MSAQMILTPDEPVEIITTDEPKEIDTPVTEEVIEEVPEVTETDEKPEEDVEIPVIDETPEDIEKDIEVGPASEDRETEEVVEITDVPEIAEIPEIIIPEIPVPGEPVEPDFYEIIPEYNSDGRLCNHGSGSNPIARVPKEEWERFNMLAGRQHEIVDGIVVYNPDLEPCLPDPEKFYSSSDDIETIKELFVIETKRLLTVALSHPIEFNGKFYSVTMEKQNLLSAQLGLFMLNTQAGVPYELTWNETGGQCSTWEFADLLMLSNAIDAHVKPLVKLQQETEDTIYAAETVVEIEMIIKEYTVKLSASVYGGVL